MASIALRDVTKVFDRRITAVCDVTLDVRGGEFLAIVGPSGCGKTTILRLIAGLETPTSGEVRIADRVVNQASPRDRNIAMVFQEGLLYPHLSVRDNLAFPLRVRRQPEPEVTRRVDAVIDMLGMRDLADRKPANLSGGQRQRVALGRAVVREPAAFLFDEPLSSLDAGLRQALRREIKTLHQRLGTTMLYVTHDQSEAMALGERICVLRDGRVQQVGSPGEVYDRPVNRFVAGFFGTPPMNFLTGRIRYESGTDFIDLESGSIELPASVGSPPPGHRDKSVVVGLRPHDLALEPSSGQGDNRLCGHVTLIEPLGSRTDVHVCLRSGETCIVCASSQSQVKAGDEVVLNILSKRPCLFEADAAGLDIISQTMSGS